MTTPFNDPKFFASEYNRLTKSFEGDALPDQILRGIAKFVDNACMNAEDVVRQFQQRVDTDAKVIVLKEDTPSHIMTAMLSSRIHASELVQHLAEHQETMEIATRLEYVLTRKRLVVPNDPLNPIAGDNAVDDPTPEQRCYSIRGTIRGYTRTAISATRLSSSTNPVHNACQGARADGAFRAVRQLLDAWNRPARSKDDPPGLGKLLIMDMTHIL